MLGRREERMWDGEERGGEEGERKGRAVGLRVRGGCEEWAVGVGLRLW